MREMLFHQYDGVHGRWETPIRFKINPANTLIPADQLVQATMDNVSMLHLFTDLEFQFAGLTSKAPKKYPDAEFVIGFLPADEFNEEYGNFWAYANVFWADTIYDANMVFNAEKVTSVDRFRAMQLHEWMHVLGFDHSDEPESILMSAPYHPYAYQGLLRLPDIVALVKTYSGSLDNAPVCLTHDHTLYIPFVEIPATGDVLSVELKYSHLDLESKRHRFKISRHEDATKRSTLPALRSAHIVAGRFLQIDNLFCYGLRARCKFEIVGGDPATWDLVDLEIRED